MRYLAFLLLGCLSFGLQAEPVPEPDMKAIYTYNFALYTLWPESDRTHFNICTLNQDEVGLAMRKLEGKRIHGRPVAVVRLSSLDRISDCQILFIGDRATVNLPRINNLLGSEAVLTVSDMPAQNSVGIVIVPDGKRLVFDVNLERCRQAGLKLSSSLLKLARTVMVPPN